MKLVFSALRTAAMLLFAVFCLAFSLKAQNEEVLPITFGKLSDADRNFTKYDKDPDAAAVVMCDYGKTRVQNGETGFFVQYSCIRRIKIFKQEAVNEWANEQIRLRTGAEKMVSVKASAYNLENGRWIETKMEKSSVFEEKIDADRYQIKFSIPNVKVGTILEYAYIINKDDPFVRDWYFQTSIPKIHSEYRFESPIYFGYALVYYGNIPYLVKDKVTEKLPSTGAEIMSGQSALNKVDKYHWIQKDVPAFKNEPYITAAKDYISRVEFQLAYYQYPGSMMQTFFSTWEDLVQKLRDADYFGRKLKKSGTGEDLVKTLVAGKTDPKERAKAIYDYVKTTYKWNEKHNFITEQSLKDLEKSKTGTSADINLALINLLKISGLDANPILLSTRSNGQVIKEYPILDKFDNVIAHIKIGTEEIFMDATSPVRPMNMLPYEDLNGDGFFINMSDKKFKWIPLQNSFKATSYMSVDATLNESNQLVMDIANTEKGYDALDAMKLIKSKNEPTYFKETYKKLLANGKISGTSVENNGTEVFKSKAKIATTDYVDASGNLLYLNPMLDFGLDNNPFKALERQYPVDFVYPKENLYQFSLAVPKGYKVSEVPKSTRLAWQDGSVKFDYIVEATDQKIVIKSKISLKNPVFMPAAYKELRDFYGKIASKHAEQIIFTKIK
jgi:Domain of Unknown Function with PDB structure (DUF3857)/Transglutaminase-like superfamily